MDPEFDFEVPRERVALYNGELTLVRGNDIVRGPGEIEFCWFPERRFEASLSVKWASSAGGGDIFPLWQWGIDKSHEVRLEFPNASKGPRLLSMGYQKLGTEISVSGTLEIPVGGFFHETYAAVDAIRFHIPNSLNLIISNPGDDQEAYSLLPHLISDTWTISLEPTADAKTAIDVLEASSGFAITQLAEIKRSDGGDISASDALDVLDALAWFLSFINADWVGPTLPVGFKSGKRVWDLWHAWKTAPWHPRITWLNPYYLEHADELFPKFMARWTVPRWREVLRTAIHWYIEAGRHAGGVEGSIVLAQTALELMASAIIVEERKMLTAKGLGRLIVAEQLRLLFSLAALPVQHCDTAKLAPLLSLRKSLDAPEALTTVRNSIVHSDLKTQNAIKGIKGALEDVSQVYLWYLEMIILNFIDYRGHYWNRIKDKSFRQPYDVDIVPWADKIP
jgi:hypothetical protein